MKKNILYFIFSLFITKGIAQEANESKTLLKEMTSLSCKCIDSINVSNKTHKTVSSEINTCIKKKALTYQYKSKLSLIDTTKVATSSILINKNEDSDEFKKYYYEMERYLVDNCDALTEKATMSAKKHSKITSENPEAIAFYKKGNKEAEKDNTQEAINLYKKALKIDPNFTSAWNNLGLSYKKLENYDEAIGAYEKSLEKDPNGIMPLQNMAIAYKDKKDYKKALKTYEKLARLDDQNPEIYYGIGQICALSLHDFEKGLDNMCKAYTLYVEQKSPYRADAEKMINLISVEMEKAGKEKTFKKILKHNNISI